ncbi:MAG TPA: SpoIIE family protein phosphatase [Solirubrobacteraceae bacterium]|nr:SpoIIE family protein phosphatase [Solirubrobacteraceae bacterium]
MTVETGSLTQLEPVLDAVPTPLLLIEPGTARVLYVNPAAHRLAGGRMEKAHDSDYASVYGVFDPSGRRLASEEHPGVRAARGEQLENVAVDWVTPAGRRSIVVSAHTVSLGAAGEVALLTFEDVTELEAARRRSTLLAEASAHLGRSLDPREVAVSIAELMVPGFADWGFVELLQPDGGILREGMAMADPAKRPIAEAYDRLYPLDPDSPIGSPQVIRSGEPQLLAELPPEFVDVAAPDPRQREVFESIGFRSIMIVPLRARGRVIGDLALAMAESDRRYSEEDLELAQQLADRCALALDNARLFTELSEAVEAARRAGDEVNTILGGVADAVTAQAPDGSLVYANEAAVAITGYHSVGELLTATPGSVASRFEMTDEHGGALDIEQLPGRRAMAGERPEPLVVRSRLAGTREWRWSRVKATPVLEPDGRVRLAINVIEDITELKRAEQGQRFLAEAGRVLAGSLDYEETLAAVARLAVPDIADWCAVDAIVDGELRRLATAHSDPRKVAEVLEIAERYPPDPSAPTGVHAVLRSGRSEVYQDISDELLVSAARDEGHLALLRSIGMTSAMAVPMILRGSAVGAITFVSAETGHAFDDWDLELAESLASRAATAIENARLYQARSAIARTLQASLLPPALPDVPGFELAAVYRSASEGTEVGGDFYDVFNTAEDQWYAIVGDVCGKGAEAAAVTAMARYTLRAAAVRRRSPAAILRLLGEAMLRQESPDLVGRFCTIACLHLDLSRTPARATVAVGGHPLPAVLRADGTVEELGTPGTLLGLVERPELHDRAGDVHPGDTVVLYTDGLTEAGAPERVWDSADLAEALRGAAGGSPQQVVDHALREALGVQPAPRDDIAVVALRARA